MPRVWLGLFIISLLALCWLGMMAVHELGHVIGAIGCGGTVTRVVLHPLAISRTDVSPNPHPGIVVWLGPGLGCLLPLLIALAMPVKYVAARNIAMFFAGFCLIANGAYIGVGSFEGIGDCGEMLRTGTPLGVMWLFGIVAVGIGFGIWHRLGSVRELFHEPSAITSRVALGSLLVLVVAVAGLSLLSD